MGPRTISLYTDQTDIGLRQPREAYTLGRETRTGSNRRGAGFWKCDLRGANLDEAGSGRLLLAYHVVTQGGAGRPTTGK